MIERRSPGRQQTTAARLLPMVVIAGAATAMVWWTWGTWADVLIDFGRELYVPWRIVSGQRLYADVAYFNGPLSPYVNAEWFRLLGVSLRSLIIGNLILTAALIWLLYRVFRAMSTAFAATLSCLTFVGLFGFNRLSDVGNYNFVTPYAHDITHGVICAFVALYALHVFLQTGKSIAVAGAGLALGLTFLTKAEVFLAAGTALTVGLGLAFALGERRSRAIAMTIVTLTAFAIPVAAAFFFLSMRMSARDAAIGVLGSWPHVFNRDLRELYFYQHISGSFAAWDSAVLMLRAALGYVVAFGLAGIGALALGRKQRIEFQAAGGVAVLCFCVVFGRIVSLEHVARPLPLLMLATAIACGFSVFRAWHDPERARRSVVALSVVLFSFGLLAKIVLNVRIYQYGFALAMPAALVMVVCLVDWIPRRIGKAGGRSLVFTGIAVFAWITLLAMNLLVEKIRLAELRYAVGDGADTLRADSRGALVNEALVEIRARVQSDQTLAVLPEGVMINYLSRRISSSSYISFIPPELAMFGEGRMLASLRNNPPDYVLTIDRPTEEYGVSVFGRDFGGQIVQWVNSNYEPVAAIPATAFQQGRFGMRLLHRKNIVLTQSRVF